MRFFAVGLLSILLLLGAYGVWLVATPDYDGGRRPVGTIVLALAALLLLTRATVFRRSRR